jgi:hypothetical protein
MSETAKEAMNISDQAKRSIIEQMFGTRPRFLKMKKLRRAGIISLSIS